MPASDRTRLGAADTTEPGAGDTVDEHGSGSHPPRPPPNKGPGPLIAAGLAICVGLGGAFFALTQDPPTPIEKPPPKGDPVEESFDERLAKARTCLDSMSDSPDWDRCEAAVKRALDDDPIHQDANAIARRLGTERAAHKEWTQGNQALGFSRIEDAFEALERIPRDSYYFARARELAQRTLPEAKKMWTERCKKYASTNKWPQAAVDCGWVMRVGCGALHEAELSPAPNQPRCVSKGKPKDCWAPKDENLGRLLAAMEKTDPGAAPWVCPRHPLYSEDKAPVVVAESLPPQGDPALDKALGLYVKGNVNEANTGLQKLQEKTENAAIHSKARALQRDITSADGLLKQGQTHLAQGRIESAAKAFEEALEIDKRLSGKALTALRKTIQTEMAEAALERARQPMERGDIKAGCKLLKLGYKFGKANIDLLTALNACSNAAAGTLAGAKDCAALDGVIELSVDPDGVKEKAQAKKAELGCP